MRSPGSPIGESPKGLSLQFDARRAVSVWLARHRSVLEFELGQGVPTRRRIRPRRRSLSPLRVRRRRVLRFAATPASWEHGSVHFDPILRDGQTADGTGAKLVLGSRLWIAFSERTNL